MIEALDAREWARELGISQEAVELYLESEVVDLHLDSFIWTRVFGYDLRVRHARAPLGGWFLGHADVPRVREARLAAATWVVTTNPWRERNDRLTTLVQNVERLKSVLGELSEDVALVTTLGEYRAARAGGRHAALIGIQGGDALEADHGHLERLLPGVISRVTLVHLLSSSLGTTSSPLKLGPDRGLGPQGKDLVRFLNHARVLVDLAHVGPHGFWDILDAHDPTLPAIVTHTGVSGVHRHWRNLDDAQLRAIAHTQGLVGILFHAPFLGKGVLGARSDRIVDHLEHVIRVAGEDAAALGSDFDGAIVPPRDLRSVLELPRLVEHMLRRRWSTQRIQKVLGENFLRVLGSVRP